VVPGGDKKGSECEATATSMFTVALSKEHRVMVAMAMSTLFFLTELIVGFRNHSLVLVADAFHQISLGTQLHYMLFKSDKVSGRLQRGSALVGRGQNCLVLFSTAVHYLCHITHGGREP
jgi:hypothetical protein